MINTTSSDQSDITSMTTTSSPSQHLANYYVQSPSRDSHEDDTSASATATTQAPSESPSSVSLFGRQSRPSSSGSRVSGFRRKGRRERRLLGHVTERVKEKEREMYVTWWRDEEGEELSRSCKVLMGVMVLGLMFVVGCFVIWGAARPFTAQVFPKDRTMRSPIGLGKLLWGVFIFQAIPPAFSTATTTAEAYEL